MRRYRVRGMTRLLTQERVFHCVSDWFGSVIEARCCRLVYVNVVVGSGWSFWVEPEDMSVDEVGIWVVPEFVEFVLSGKSSCVAGPGDDPVLVDDWCVAYGLGDWHEDFGDVLWWCFPVVESPWCGSPLSSDWPGYHTHWSRFVVPIVGF